MAAVTHTLPIELISAIIEGLAAPVLEGRKVNDTHDPNLNDLHACSLVCRNFRPLCQKYMFHTIHLETHDRMDGPVPQSTIGRFSEVVKTSPVIGSYVRKVTLWIAPHSGYDFEVYYHPDMVASALRSLTNLKTIVITPWSDPVRWNDIPASLTSEIYHLFQLPTITTIEVHKMRNFNLRSVAPCVGLEGLTLYDSSLDENFAEIPSTTVSVQPLQPILLTILGNSKERTLLPKIMSSKLFDFRRLETFATTMTYMDEVHATSDFLQQLKCPFLKTIDLGFPLEIDEDAISVLSLSIATKVIKNLVIAYTCHPDVINYYLFGLCLFLQHLSNENRIQSLKIYVNFLPSASDFVDDPNWDVVNNTLLATGWSLLTKVELQIMSTTDQVNLPQAITRAAILKKLPQTRLKGLASSKSFEFLWSLTSIVKDPRGFQYTADL